MGIVKRGENGKNSIRKYYDQLKQDGWRGNSRDKWAPYHGRTGRAKHLHGAAILGGLYLLGQFRSTEPRLYTAAKYAVAPILGTTVLGKIANTATDVLRAAQQLGALPMELTNNYPDIAITNNPLERIKSVFAKPQVSNDIRKKYGLQYATDKSFSTDLGEATNPDLIPVSFKSGDGTFIPVRGTISGLSDTVTPTWNETSYVGRPQAVVTYGGFGREIAFDLTIAAVNPGQLRPMWHKINDIMNLVLPQTDMHQTRFAGRLTEITIGNYIEEQLCAVTGITITPHEESYWETMDPDIHHPSLTLDNSAGNKLQDAAQAWINQRRANKSEETITVPLSRKAREKLVQDNESRNFIMPRVVTLNIALKVLHNAVPGANGEDLFHVNQAPTLGTYVGVKVI